MKVRYALSLLLSAACGSALAQEAGDNVVQVGVFHIETLDSSDELRTELRPSLIGDVLGIEDNFTSPGTSASVGSADTLALTYTRFLTHHWALKIEGGIPAEFELSGAGVVAPTGITGALFNVDLGDPANNPLATARQWSPAILLQYYFRGAEAKWRPYVGAGISYTWFTDVELKDAFSDDLNQQFGAVLALAAGKPGATRTDAEASTSLDPIINAGLAWALSENWGLSSSISFAPISTTATINITAEDGTRLARSRTDIDTNPLVMSLFLNYRF